MDTTTSRTRNRTLPVVSANACCSTVAAPTLAPERANHLAEQLKAVADPTRLRILDMLSRQSDPFCVCDITAQFSQNQPTISHHLRILREAGLVECEKRGVWAYYWATERGKQQLVVLGTLE
jgi:ArsR family transcriptional regulator, arsenate/arsenite/antimonite-responsive transcriptional repressor